MTRLLKKLSNAVLLLILFLSCSMIGYPQNTEDSSAPASGALTYYDSFLGEDVPFPASVPMEVRRELTSPMKTVAVKTLSQAAAQMAAFPPDYEILDSIPPGSLGTTWTTAMNEPWSNPVPYRSEVVSPYDGSTALRQQAIGNTYSYCTHAYILRSFNVGECLPGSRVAFFMSVNRLCSSCVYDACGVAIGFYRGARYVGSKYVGTAGSFNPWGLSFPNGFRGIVDIPIDFVSEPFDRFVVYVSNYCCVGNNETIFDELRFKPLRALSITKVEAVPQTLYMDPSGHSSGIIFRATTTAATTVSFTVEKPDHTTLDIGSAETQLVDGTHVAGIKWKPSDSSLVAGGYTIIAKAGGNQKSGPFTVIRISEDAYGAGTWLNTKDPASGLPVGPQPNTCPLHKWDELVLQGNPNFNALAVKDPVNIRFGSLIRADEDLSLQGRHSLVLARIYNSLDFHPGPFGIGWNSPYHSRLELGTDTIVFVNSDGGRVRFDKNGQAWSASETIQLSLRYSTDTGYWTVSQAQGSEWTYDAQGRLLRMAKACCGLGATDAVLCEYDSEGRLSKVSNPGGQSFAFSSDANGRITTVTDSTGRTGSYGYTDDGRLSIFTDPMGRITRYAYASESGFLVRIDEPGNRVTEVTYVAERVSSITSPDGEVSRFAWDNVIPRLTLTDATGAAHEYRFTSDWVFSAYAVPSLGLTKTFTLNDAGLVTRFENSLGQTRTFNLATNGQLAAITDELGNTTSFEYHPTFRKVTKKTDSLGRVWQYDYCDRGNLICEMDPAGGVVSYRYDAWNNRTSKIDQLGRITRYVYDQTGDHLVQVIDSMGGISSFTHDARGNLLSSMDQLGRKTVFEYDLLDRLTKTTYPDGRFTTLEYDLAGNITARRDQSSRETRYVYDLANRVTSITRPDGTIQAMAYDAAGRKISETDPLGRITRFEYSELGRLTKTIYPDGTYETMTYDTESRLVSKTNELGQTTNLEYDAMGRLLATIDPTGARWESQYDNAGRKIADKDPLNRVTTYQHDVLDRVTKVIRPDSSFTTSSFDAVGNLLSTVDALGNQWGFVYDSLNRQVKAIQPNGASSTTAFDAAGQVIAETDALGAITRHSFDNGGRKTATTDALGNVWRNMYDSAGRLVATKDPLGAVSSLTYDIMDRVVSQADPLGNVTSFEFDSAGRRVAKTDPEGRRSITAYDQRDRVTSEVDPEGHTVQYGYNLAGQRVSLTDGANRTWRWEHDALGRVVAAVDPMGNIERTSYDAVGNVVSKTNARNQMTAFTVDSMNRVTGIAYPDGAVATFAFDLEGRELVRSSSTGSVVKTWDSVGNMTSETFGPWGKEWQYSFDLAGNRIQAIDPEGQVFKYRADALHRVVELDPPAKGDEIKYSFDPAGRLIGEERPGVKTVNTFDAAGRLLEMKHERDHGKEKVVASRQYQYSAAGNRISQTDENGEKTLYSFNNSDWLTKVVYPDGKQVSYAFNGAGDRTEERIETPTVKKVGRDVVLGTDTVVVPLAYDAGGRLVSRASDTFGFDADGNQVAAVEGGDETRFAWTSDNRLAKVEKDVECSKHGRKRCHQCPQTVTVAEEYGYLPGDWRRVRRKADGQEFFSAYDIADESHEYVVKQGRDDDHHHRFGPRCPQPKPKLELVREFIGGPGTDDLEVTKYRGRSLALLKDALGSTIALTNRGGHLVAKIGYDAWGSLVWPDNPRHGVKPCEEKDLDDYLDRCDGGRGFENTGFDPSWFGRHHGKRLTPYLYTGRRWDSFSGQYFHRNRYMNPKYGRFTSRDPISFNGGSNLWIYANNNPLIYVDPMGLEYKLVSGDPALFAAAEARLRQTTTGAKILNFMKSFPGLVKISLDTGTDPQIVTRRGKVGLPPEVATGKREYGACDNDIPMVIYFGAKQVKVGLKWRLSDPSWLALELGHEGAHVLEPTLHEEKGEGSPLPGVYEKYERAIYDELRKLGLLFK